MKDGSGGPGAARQSHGRAHTWVADASRENGGRILTAVVPLERLDESGEGRARLWGRHVRVRNASVFNRRGAHGAVEVVAAGDAQPDEQGDFLFDPCRGGARIDKLTFRSEKYCQRYVEASRFGEVNSYYHLDRAAHYVHGLLLELGAAPLPLLLAVVNAHSAATQRPDGTRDGILRAERWVPFQGGHYRLPARQFRVAEYEPLAPHGEIHLGPGWKLLEHGALVDSAGAHYRHVASHNAGTLYHEYGHHVTRHTADFRANSLRKPERQSNAKTEIDEGFCDYLAAILLETPHIWAWHRRHDEVELHGRSLAAPVTMEDYDGCSAADPHANGTILAGTLWELRTELAAERAADGTDGGRACDRLVLKALLRLGETWGAPPITVQGARRARAGFAAMLQALLEADRELEGGAYRAHILGCFALRGIHPDGAATNGRARSVRRGERATSPDGSSKRWRFGDEELRAKAQARLLAARARLVRHVPEEDIPESEDLFGRGELGARLRELQEPPLSLIVVGDTMIGGRTTPLLSRHGPEYVFKFVRPLMRRAALVLGNLEGPLALEARRELRNFSYRVNGRLALVLRRAGFRVMTLANNHLLDCGRRGVIETLDSLKEVGITPIGAGRSEEEAHAPLVREAHGLKLGLLGYYWNRRTSARGKLPGSAMDPPEALRRDIAALRAQADRIVVTFHWGVPYVREPSPADREKARWAIECGADAVIGHHPHVLQAFEIHRDRPIFYSVGNFAFGSGNSKAEGLLVGLRFEPARTQLFAYPLYVKNRDPRVRYQPKVLRGQGARHVLEKLVALSGADGARLALEDFRATLELPWAARSDWPTSSPEIPPEAAAEDRELAS